MPEKNATYGDQSGQYLNYKSLELYLKTLQPEANDIFKLSLFVINVACLLEFFTVQGSFLKRICKLVWCIGKWNCIFILLWLPLLGLFQLSYMETVVCNLLKVLRVICSTQLAAQVRHDWIQYTSTNCNFLFCTFLSFCVIIGIIEFSKSERQTPQDDNNNDSDWRSVSWDSYMNYFFRPVTVSLTQPMTRQDMDLEVGMELLIERLAVPNFWLHPIISSDYLKDLPVWTYAGSGIDSDSEGRFDSDSDDWCSNSRCSVDSRCSSIAQSQTPAMFVCEKCRVLQMARDGGVERASAQQLAESESACAKFLMDGDYKCMCRDAGAEGWHSDDEVIRKPVRGGGGGSRHRTLSSDNLLSSSSSSPSPASSSATHQHHSIGSCSHAEHRPQQQERHDKPSLNPRKKHQSSSYSCMPPGVLPCTECVICLESYKFGVLLCGLPCGHSFHQQCILGWLARDNHCCPVCRWPTYKAKPCSIHLHSE